MTRWSPATVVRGPAPARRSAGPVEVEILVCGSSDRGDDGAPIVAIGLLGHLPDGVRARSVGQLDIDDLLAVPADARVVIVDAAVGIPAGSVVELPLTGFIARADQLRPRSSHSLAFPEVIGLAELMRGHPLRGEIVAIGGAQFGLGAPLSRPVADALPRLVDTIREAMVKDGG